MKRKLENRIIKVFGPKPWFYISIIALYVIAFYAVTFNLTCAVIGVVLVLGLILLALWSEYHKRKEVSDFIDTLTFNLSSVAKDTLVNFKLPLLLLETDGTVVWYNTLFKDMFEKKDSLDKALTGLFDGKVNPKQFIKSNDKDIKINIENKIYKVLGNLTQLENQSDNEDYILMLYFIDITDYAELLQKYEDTRPAIGSIIVDNYEELQQVSEEDMIGKLSIEIDLAINKWVNSLGGFVRRFEKDKFLLFIENKSLIMSEDKRFEILEQVKNMNVGIGMPATLSIGIGVNGDNPKENLIMARDALNLALGRGGDQAVIKDKSNVKFYGGNTRETEKRTKVKARVVSNAIADLITESENVMIMGHKNADMDCLGSALGMYRAVTSKGKTAKIILNSSNISIDAFMERAGATGEYDDVFIGEAQALEMMDFSTLLVVVDTHRRDFTESSEILDRANKVVVIDHHRRSTDFISDTVLTYQEVYASSTCELISELLIYMDDKPKLSKLEAEGLYAGIVVDTKNFTFKTGVRTFEVASFLRRQGMDTVNVKQLFQSDIDVFKEVCETIVKADIIKDNIAIAVCPDKAEASQLVAAQAADQLLSISGIIASFVLCKHEDGVTISARSYGDMNVQLIMEKLGGGGHLTIAGARLEGVSIDEAKEKLVSVLNDGENT